MTEIEKLHAKLTEQGVNHTYERRFPQMDKDFPDTDWGWQIWVHDDNFGGNAKGVEGYLTADDVMFRLYDHLSKKKEVKNEVPH